jgi:hypothetical protein
MVTYMVYRPGDQVYPEAIHSSFYKYPSPSPFPLLFFISPSLSFFLHSPFPIPHLPCSIFIFITQSSIHPSIHPSSSSSFSSSSPCPCHCPLFTPSLSFSPATARTSPWCWGPVALRGEAKTSPCHLFHLLGFVCLLSIPRLLLTGPGATWCRLGSEERDFVTMSACNVLYRLSIFIFRFAVCHLSPAFCSPVPGKPGADWEVKRGTSSPCLLCNVLCHLSCHMFGHLSPSVGSHLIVVLGSSSPSG